MHGRFGYSRFVALCVEVGVLTAAFLLTPKDALAYIDPGTGSLAYQTILAIFLGACFVFRHTISKIARAFRAIAKRNGDSQPNA